MTDEILMDLTHRVNSLETEVRALTPDNCIGGIMVGPTIVEAIAGLYEAAENCHPPFPKYIERVGTWLSLVRKT